MKKIYLCILIAVIMTASLVSQVCAADLPLLYDEAEVLMDYEEAELLAKLESVSDSVNMDVVVAIVNSTGELSPMEYADDFFDYNGYGRGPDRDGLVLLVSMEYREWWISTRGYAITVFTDAGLEYISEQFLPYLSGDNYAAAFDDFANQCELFAAQASTGDPYDVHNLPKAPFDPVFSLVIALVIGLIIALIYTGHLKSQLKSVHSQTHASGYVKAGSLNVTESRDFFLYRNISRSVRQTSSGSSGGSSTHTSSSGASHGGRGGGF